jgi:hypothetical protein
MTHSGQRPAVALSLNSRLGRAGPRLREDGQRGCRRLSAGGTDRMGVRGALHRRGVPCALRWIAALMTSSGWGWKPIPCDARRSARSGLRRRRAKAALRPGSMPTSMGF